MRRDEQMLAGSVAVAQLLGDLDRVVQQVQKRLTGDASHAEGSAAAADLGHALDVRVHARAHGSRIGADALDDGGQVVLFRFKQSLEHMDGLCLRRLRLGSNRQRLLQSLLRRKRQLVQVTHVHS